jgi:hypothetical protein
VGLCNSPRFFARQPHPCRSWLEAAMSTVVRETIPIQFAVVVRTETARRAALNCSQVLCGSLPQRHPSPGILVLSIDFLPPSALLRPDRRRLHHRQVLIIRPLARLPPAAYRLPAPAQRPSAFCCAPALRRPLRSLHLASVTLLTRHCELAFWLGSVPSLGSVVGDHYSFLPQWLTSYQSFPTSFFLAIHPLSHRSRDYNLSYANVVDTWHRR